MHHKSLHQKSKGKVVVSWTGGKDGCFACYKAMLNGFEVAYLLNFKDLKKTAPHNLDKDLLFAQSEAIGIPLLYRGFVSYEDEFKKVVRELNSNGAGIGGAVFGHVALHEHLVTRMCAELGLTLYLPFWGHDTEQLMSAFIDAGFEAIIASTKADMLGEVWLGRKLDRDFLHDLRSMKPTIDPCGEYGEFHTFVIDGPRFKNRIAIHETEKRLENGYWFLDITDYSIECKAH
ncbi:MAG: diphthine--ammonia ligase [Candidatus Methanospirareceae archaeon]